MRNLFLKWHV